MPKGVEDPLIQALTGSGNANMAYDLRFPPGEKPPMSNAGLLSVLRSPDQWRSVVPEMAASQTPGMGRPPPRKPKAPARGQRTANDAAWWLWNRLTASPMQLPDGRTYWVDPTRAYKSTLPGGQAVIQHMTTQGHMTPEQWPHPELRPFYEWQPERTPYTFRDGRP